ncbi:alpha/beta fold hydrolase [Kitasatospora sp. NPDC008050]|uniref:alpha/beta fold hydrolase n=1 Tax=Kitasatospora sp. NPDC008050 TaxID=3364021 RepID=UPI0036E5FF7C
MSLAAVGAALLGASLTPVASAHSAPAKAKPTVVLEHGAFADASGWNGVAQRLQHDGYTVIAPANPLRGLPEDSAYLTSVLKGIQGPIVLVGHSYGGAVITQAAAGNPQIKALVYIAALMPDKGEVLGALTARSTQAQLQPALKPLPYANADGTGGTDLYIDPARFHDVFAADVPTSQTNLMAAEQRPVTAATFASTATAAAWHTIPSWAMIATQDKTLGADVERFEAERAGSHTVEVNSSHVAMISHPAAVTHLIEDAANSTSH